MILGKETETEIFELKKKNPYWTVWPFSPT
jgi:hypothetical protein